MAPVTSLPASRCSIKPDPDSDAIFAKHDLMTPALGLAGQVAMFRHSRGRFGTSGR